MRTIRTPRARQRFLGALAQSANVTEACRRAGISRRAAYDWRKADAEFAAMWDQTVDAAVDRLEQEAWRRGAEGFEGRPVMYRGRVVTRIREYSDRMLELLLRAHRPEKYCERTRHELAGTSGGPLEIRIRDLASEATDEQLLEIVAGTGSSAPTARRTRR